MRLIRFLFRLIYNLLYLFFKLIKFILKILLKVLIWFKNFLIRQADFWKYRVSMFYLHFLKEFFPFFIQSCHFVNNRFVAWQLWNFEEHWTVFRTLIFLITLLSLIRPIYFVCRWTGYLWFFLCNVFFMLWRAFFLEIFIYFFRFTITPNAPYECLKLIHIFYYLYTKYSDFGNRFGFLVARGFGLVYIDFFVSYLDSLRYRDWDRWISKSADNIIYFIDEVFDFFVDVFAFYYYYKREFLWWGPIYKEKIQSFFLKIFRFFKRIFLTLRRWFSVKNFKIQVHKFKFYKSKYGRRVIKTQIKAYWTVVKAMFVISRARFRIAKKYCWAKLKWHIKWMVPQWLIFITVNIYLWILRFINFLIDQLLWLIFDTFLWDIFFERIYVFFLWLHELIFYRAYKRISNIKRKLLYFLHDKPLFRYFLKERYEFNQNLFRKKAAEYGQVIFAYQRKFPYMVISYDEKGKMLVKKITDQEEIDNLVSSDVAEVRKMWEEEGEICESHLAWLTEMRIQLINDRRQEEFLAFKENCEIVRKFILNKRSIKENQDKINQKKILSLDDFFSRKQK